jgi:hypothetical protein
MKKPSEDGSTEFKQITEGWHKVTFQDGIQPNIKKLDDGKESKTLLVPWKIEEDSEDNGAKGAIYIPWGQTSGEQRIVDILNATVLLTAFEEKYPGDVSAFDPQIVSQFSKRVPGKACAMRFGKQRPPNDNFMEVKQIVSFAWAKEHGVAFGAGGEAKREPVVEDGPTQEAKGAAKGGDGW